MSSNDKEQKPSDEQDKKPEDSLTNLIKDKKRPNPPNLDKINFNIKAEDKESKED